MVKEAPTDAKKFRSSWDAKDVTGRTYIENLGKESANMNIVVGAKEGMIDSVFVGDFLGKEGGHLATFFSGGELIYPTIGLHCCRVVLQLEGQRVVTESGS